MAQAKKGKDTFERSQVWPFFIHWLHVYLTPCCMYWIFFRLLLCSIEWVARACISRLQDHNSSLHESAQYSEKGTFSNQTRAIATLDGELFTESKNSLSIDPISHRGTCAIGWIYAVNSWRWSQVIVHNAIRRLQLSILGHSLQGIFMCKRWASPDTNQMPSRRISHCLSVARMTAATHPISLNSELQMYTTLASLSTYFLFSISHRIVCRRLSFCLSLLWTSFWVSDYAAIRG
jgi:hypothetical protein